MEIIREYALAPWSDRIRVVTPKEVEEIVITTFSS